jgi:pyruvate/2-oxoglutarate dehydrogenase complex dihydrolipoamide dehydrogenase (E3) component
MTPKGDIETDEFQNTSAKNIYAVGDVIGKWQLTPGNVFFYEIFYFISYEIFLRFKKETLKKPEIISTDQNRFCITKLFQM